MPTARFALTGGLGYPYTETAAGLPYLKERLEAIGAQAEIFEHTQSQEAYNYTRHFIGFLGFIGDSLGAGASAAFADNAGRADFVAGFQPSNYDPLCRYDEQTGLYYIKITKVVKVAHCIRDPLWLQTFGLGNATYEREAGDKQPLLVTEHYGAHPDDWGWSQDLIFNQVKGMLVK